MSPRYGVIGPLHEPANRSGVHGGGCSHAAPDSCSRCDGTGEDAWEERKAYRSPSGRRMSDAEVMRLVEACRPTTTYTEEAS